ncbi:Protein of unknown function [Gryllus bimaculatus]|nr:Protein of unknown function [Gryllus bimaculatus]
MATAARPETPPPPPAPETAPEPATASPTAADRQPAPCGDVEAGAKALLAPSCRRQHAAALLAHGWSVCVGAATAWTSPALRADGHACHTEDESVRSARVADEASWMRRCSRWRRCWPGRRRRRRRALGPAARCSPSRATRRGAGASRGRTARPTSAVLALAQVDSKWSRSESGRSAFTATASQVFSRSAPNAP